MFVTCRWSRDTESASANRYVY